MEYVGGKANPCRDIWFRADCQPGQYLAFVSTNWDFDYSNDYSIWAYGPKNISIERVVDLENNAKVPELMADCYKKYVKLKKI